MLESIYFRFAGNVYLIYLLPLISSFTMNARGRESSEYDTRDILMFGLEKSFTDLDVGLRHDVY